MSTARFEQREDLSMAADGVGRHGGGGKTAPASTGGSGTSAVSPSPGEAVAITMLLSDWDNFGLSERVGYHFELIETLTCPQQVSISANAKRKQPKKEDEGLDRYSATQIFRGKGLSVADNGVSGVVSLLECIPAEPISQMMYKKRRAFNKRIRQFNIKAQAFRQAATETSSNLVPCYEPRNLPLRLSPQTRVSFVYEVTRIAFCLDASPTLTSAFGNVSDDCCCCLDRLPSMAERFFQALVKPISRANNGAIWEPHLAVTVVAVYPRNTGKPETSVLVRDFRVFDVDTARHLSDRIAQWALQDVETEIASRMSRSGGSTVSWRVPTSSSSLEDILEAGDVALSLLPFQGRPCVVVATDCRAVACDSVLDLVTTNDRVDTPLFVLDLSNANSHIPSSLQSPVSQDFINSKPSILTWDPVGPGTFPLHLSDDSEILFEICNATGGCFLDSELLQEVSSTTAGQVPPTSNLHSDQFLSFRRRSLRPNALQWYLLFATSPLSPTLNPASGKLVSPRYMSLRKELIKAKPVDAPPNGGERGITNPEMTHMKRRVPNRIAFSSYVLSPVRIKGLLLMRIKEGYRARQYGQNTQDADRVSVQFTLPIDQFGIVLHYELSYRASPSSPMVGVAHIKIELSGDTAFIQSVKNDFLAHDQLSRPSTLSKQASAKLCKVLRWFRKEDCLQSYLCPMEWSHESPLFRRLDTLSHLQRHHHFRKDKFDVLCVGQIPLGGDEGLLSEFIEHDNGERDLYEAMSDWSDQIIIAQKRFVKEIKSGHDDLPSYGVAEVVRSASTSRLFSVSLESFGGICGFERLPLLASLKNAIVNQKDVVILPVLMDEYLAAYRNESTPDLRQSPKQRFLENHYHHDTWELPVVQDTEFLPLLTKRMTEIRKYWLLDSTESRALFVKFVQSENTTDVVSSSSDLHLVQYQVEILPSKVFINFYMDTLRGHFFPFRQLKTDHKEAVEPLLFQNHVEKVRNEDEECCLALSSRRSLLRLFDEPDALQPDISIQENHETSVRRLLMYSSRDSRKLRFFQRGAGTANSILEELTTSLMLSQAFGVPVAKLAIAANIDVGDIEPGLWFLIQHDKQTLSIAHLALTERYETADGEVDQVCYRDLSFFTIGVSDLYYARDADDENDSDHISEYLVVSDFGDRIEAAHGENYARAAYLALRRELPSKVEGLHANDFEYLLRYCSFAEAASVSVSKEIQESPLSAESVSKSRLCQVISNMFSAIPGVKNYLFYHGEEISEHVFVATDDIGNVDLDIFDEVSRDGEDDMVFSVSEEDTETTASRYRHRSLSVDTNEKFVAPLVQPPIFVKFSVDNEVVSLSDLSAVEKISTLVSHISLFLKVDAEDSKEPFNRFESHSSLVERLRSRLDAYVAEENLERSRYLGPSISDLDLDAVKSCLRKAHNVASSVVPVNFYIPRRDAMVDASVPAGSEAEVGESFSWLSNELQKNDRLHFKSTRSGFFVIQTTENVSTLSFWCFVDIRKRTGGISIKVYHPLGMQDASSILLEVQNAITETAHRVNQLLLLQSLHRTRNASSFLIPEVGVVDATSRVDQHLSHQQREAVWSPGCLSCPIQFRANFVLYHRCAASQVVKKLEASVLDRFAVSNRQGVFVYKDEEGAIFYMRLHVDNVDGDDFLELLVHGVHKPGPSVTKQLKRLLEKKLASIAVESLSNVLTKNALFNWKPSDLEFVRTFEERWSDLHDEQETFLDDRDRMYDFPLHVYDPLMVLVYFRQNICGSTYFHLLHEAADEEDQNLLTGFGKGDGTHTESDHVETTTGAAVRFDHREFSFFFNNSPSPLDPSFQPVSTLTDRGSGYARQTGNGIALVEVALVGFDGSIVESMEVGEISQETESRRSVPATLRVQKMGKGTFRGEATTRVRVRIVSTALNREVLHRWIELTLNQVLISWSLERHIEKSLTGMGPESPETETRNRGDSLTLMASTAVDRVCPGLPWTMSVLSSSHGLPHPAIKRLKLGGMIRASALAKLTLELLEKCIMPRLMNEKRVSWTSFEEFPQLSIIRICKKQDPVIVNFSMETGSSRVVPVLRADSQPMKDAQIDCPEYLCYYCFHQYAQQEVEHSSPSTDPPLQSVLFREVMVEGTNDRKSRVLSEVMMALKRSRPSVFRRSLAFVLRVSRENRLFFTYNWEPSRLEQVTTRFKELDASFSNLAAGSLQEMQLRCLGVLSPQTARYIDKNMETPSSEPTASLKQPHDSRARGALPQTTPSVQSKTKMTYRTPIRRPKLIGKSVEGAAMQAMAASRARASANRPKSYNSAAPGASYKSQKEKPVASPKSTRAGKQGVKTTAKGRSGAESRSMEDKDLAMKHSEDKREDRALSAFFNEYERANDTISRSPTLSLSPRVEATLELLSSWWNDDGCRLTPSMLEFVLTQSTFHLCTACELLHLPPHILKLASFSLARSIVATSRLQFLPLRGLNRSETDVGRFSAPSNVVYLWKELRTSRKHRHVMVATVSTFYPDAKIRIVPIVQWKSWIVTLRRGFKGVSFARRYKRRSTARRERDFDLIHATASELHGGLALEAEVFNFAAAFFEHVVQSQEPQPEIASFLKQAVDRFTVEQQRRLPGINYRLVKARLVLSSYRDEYISLFDAPTLSRHLKANAKDHDFFCCGADVVCNKEPFSIFKTQSYSFLTEVSGDEKVLEAIVLCRMDGTCLERHVRRGDSPYARTIQDWVVIEGARVARDTLRSVAVAIRRESLWDFFSDPSNEKCAPNEKVYQQFCALVYTVALADIEPRLSLLLRDRDEDAGINWKSCCSSMRQDPFFRPARLFPKSDDQSGLFVFFLKDHDVFLTFNIDDGGTLLESNILSKQETKAHPEFRLHAAKVFTNYLLHYMWSNL